MTNNTQNDWEGRITLFINDAWSRGSNWAMKGRGYAMDTNADREAELAIELVNNLLADVRLQEYWKGVAQGKSEATEFYKNACADARREVIDAIQMVLDYAKQDVEMADDPDDPRVRIKYLEHKLATLRKEGA